MAELCVLINDGAEFNLDEVDGEPVLFYAAKNNFPLVVTRLSDAGLDLNATDDEGKTALFYANCNNSMDVLCELICQGVEFKLDEINGKAVLFHAAKNKCKHVVKPLYDAGLDLDITDEQGKTVVFYGNNDFLDALKKVVKVCINARDHYGRTPLFYAIQDNDTTKAWYLIEKGANAQLKDNCNVSIFTLYVENCILKKGEMVKLFNSELFQKEQHFKDLSLAIFDTLYCQAPLLSVGIPRLIESYTISKKDNILNALAFIRQHCLFQDANDQDGNDQDGNNQDAIINELIVSMTEKNEIDVPHILSLLIRLGTNPQATDSHGNTALHYATLLPLFGVTQKAVLDICKKVRNFGALLDAKNHQCESPLLFSLSSSMWEVITENNNWHSSISGFAEVCKFLLSNINGLQNADTIFHRIISLVQLGLELSEEVSRNAVLQVLIGVLELLQPEEKAVKNVVNYTDTRLNSPLHLWASISLKSPQDYTRSLTRDFTFERILKRILDHLLKCGANVNARNVNDETPLHKCKTLTAVKLLLDAKANPNDHNSSGYSPLLAAAKKSNAQRKTGHLYPDVTEDLGSFWRIEKGFDLWMADHLIRDDVKPSILNVIRQDEYEDAQWKPVVEFNLKSLTTSRLALDSPLSRIRRYIGNFCRLDEEPVSTQQKANEKLNNDVWEPPTKEAKTDKSETKEEEKQKSNERQVSNDSDTNYDPDVTGNEAKCFYAFCIRKARLFYAAKSNSYDIVQELHFENFDLNVIDDEGKTALFYANRNHCMDALCKLIECDAEFMLDEIDAKAVVFHAAKYDYSVTVEKVLGKNFDVNITDDEGKTALFYANLNHSMDALCKLIECDAEFTLNEIDGKAVLFYAAKNRYGRVVKPLYDKGIDLNTTDEQGKTVVFYGDKFFLDTLVKVVEIVIDARDHHGRTPLFYALQDDDTTKAQYLIEKGANFQLKDNCNVSIFIFFIETCISKNLEAMDLFTTQLFQEESHRKALIRAIFNILYCQAPLLSVTSFTHLLKPYAIFNQTNVIQALAFASKQYINQDSDKVGNIDEVVKMIKEKVTDVPRIISLLINLGADPQTTDSDGNTAFHYATLLPLYGVTQEVIMDTCEKLQRFGTIFHAKNHQHQSPLLFCLSSYTWKVVFENNSWQSSIRGLVEVCRFLLNSRNVIMNSQFIFHRIILLIQQGLNLNEEKLQRKAVVQVLLDILEMLQPHQDAVRNAVNYTDTLLNSPLHLWASIALKTPQDYEGFKTEEFTFKSILKRILDHLLKCGAEPNARNVYEETPLHMCRTWAAVTFLLDAGANPNDQNSSGHSPLLVAAKKKNAPTKKGYLYPDVTEEPEPFWKSVLQKGLDPSVVCKQGKTILDVLIESEEFALSRALIEIACKEESTTDNVKLSILNVICHDESKHTHWKTILVDIVLKSPGPNRLALESPLRLCCRNIVKFGMFDDGQPVSEIQQMENEKSSYDGQPHAKKARKSESTSNDSVYCKIAKQLLSYAPDIDIDTIANDYPCLQDLLTKSVEIDNISFVIPWASVSSKHKAKLAKVARRQEVTLAGQIWYHRDKIGNGSFGSIFAGINTKDGREVAVKRIDKSRLERREDKREIENLVRLADCTEVVHYIYFFENENFSHLVLELMEGNLEELLDRYAMGTAEVIRLCKSVLMGLQFLHKQNILHRDLKPQNILYNVVDLKPCLKIADFGLSRTVESKCTTVFGTFAGTRCWIAPEVLTSKKYGVDSTIFSQASDVFSCGILLHYIFSARKHPFNPADCANKDEMQVSHETEANIMNDKMDGWDNSLCPETTHLVKKMLENNKEGRPTASKALEHPLFWSNKRKVNFLKAASSHEKFTKEHDPNIEAALKNSMERGRWNNKNKYKHMSKLHTEMSKFRKYHVRSVVDLVRLIRNVYEHSREISLDESVQTEKLLFTDYVFFENFPHLVMEVYKYVTEHKLDEAAEIKSAMDQEY